MHLWESTTVSTSLAAVEIIQQLLQLPSWPRRVWLWFSRQNEKQVLFIHLIISFCKFNYAIEFSALGIVFVCVESSIHGIEATLNKEDNSQFLLWRRRSGARRRLCPWVWLRHNVSGDHYFDAALPATLCESAISSSIISCQVLLHGVKAKMAAHHARQDMCVQVLLPRR